MKCCLSNFVYLKHWRVDEILLQEGLGAHVVHDGGGQVLEDGVHGVPGLLPRHPEVLLQRPGDTAERRMVMRMMIMNVDNNDSYLGKMDWAAS